MNVRTSTPPSPLAHRPMTYETALGLIVRIVRTHRDQTQEQFAVLHHLGKSRVSRMERGIGEWTVTELGLVSRPWNLTMFELLAIASHIIAMLKTEAPLVDFRELEQWPLALTPNGLRSKIPEALITRIVGLILERTHSQAVP